MSPTLSNNPLKKEMVMEAEKRRDDNQLKTYAQNFNYTSSMSNTMENTTKSATDVNLVNEAKEGESD